MTGHLLYMPQEVFRIRASYVVGNAEGLDTRKGACKHGQQYVVHVAVAIEQSVEMDRKQYYRHLPFPPLKVSHTMLTVETMSRADNGADSCNRETVLSSNIRMVYCGVVRVAMFYLRSISSGIHGQNVESYLRFLSVPIQK